MSLGPLELALILGIALLLFGPSRLPGLGKSVGDAIRGFKKGMDGESDEVETKQLPEVKDDGLVNLSAKEKVQDKDKKSERS